MFKIRQLSELNKLPNNPRIIKDADFERLCTSLRNNQNYFHARPIILSDRTGELIIIAGNQRYEAAKHIGLDKVPTYLLQNMSEEQEREIIIRDNVANGEWDYSLLANEWDLDLLVDWGVEIPIDFAVEEEPIAGNIDDDEIPEVKETRAKLGDVWILGKHRLMCGNSTSITDVEKLMDGKKADMVFTDPPYNVDYSGRGQNNLGTIENDNMSADQFNDFIDAVFNCYLLVMKPLACIYVCYQDSRHIPNLAFVRSFGERFYKSSTIIWMKQSAGMGWQDYRSQHEPIMYGWKEGEGAHYYCDDRSKTTIWQIGRDASASYVHPTQKPVELPEEAIKNSSKANNIVLDLFGGSGSTLIACEKTNRINYSMELDPKYCDVIITRWEQFTGKQARLNGS